MVTNSVKRMTHFRSVSLAISLAVGLAGCGGSTTNSDFAAVDVTSPVSDWKLVWSDEFDGAEIDLSKWTHEVNCDGGGNFEQQCYTDSAENSFVADGMLNIVAKPLEGDVLPYSSARLSSKNQGDWTYGRFEMRAKLPSGQGTWPAIWMLSTDEMYGEWPRSGEIDIIEAVNLKADDNGAEERSINGQLYYGSGTADNQNQFDSSGRNFDLLDGSNPADDFHTYAIEWQEGEIRWYVDGYLYQTQMMSELRFNSKGNASLAHRGWYAEFYDLITGKLENHWTPAPFDQDFHLLLNLAVGGNWAANVNETGIDPAAFAEGASFQIDYVRVYECSVNPLDGSGCETTRLGYKDLATEENPTGALVLGVAPAPPVPLTGIAIPLTVFADAENPSWPLWSSSEDAFATIETDDAPYGAVSEFTIGESPAVVGYISRIDYTDSPAPYNAAEMVAKGNITFDMKVLTGTADPNTPWYIKLEADGNSSDSGDIALPTPVVGQWQSYSISVASLVETGLDVSAIDAIFIFPAWGQGEGAVYRVDNFKFEEPGTASFPELVIFEDGTNSAWPRWVNGGQDTTTEEFDDEAHGLTAEFILGDEATVVGFNGRQEGSSFDASALFADGVIQFDMKVITGPANASAVWLMKIETAGGVNGDQGLPGWEVPLNTSNEGVDPVVGEWQTYTFNIADLQAAGEDISAIDLVMVFPTWDQAAGAVYRIDNAKIYNPNAGAPTGPSVEVFSNANNPEWPMWVNGGQDSFSEETDDAEHGVTAEFTLGNEATVVGFNARSAENSFDASALAASGVIEFEMKVVTGPANASAVWLMKIETAGGVNGDQGLPGWEVPLNTSNEGVDPVVGEWQTYTFNVADLAAAGEDISAIDFILVFPTWDQAAGAVYRIDNVKIYDPNASAPPTAGPSAEVFTNATNPEWPLWVNGGQDSFSEETDDAGHGVTAEFTLGNEATVVGFNARSAENSFDASALAANGIIQFEMKVVTAPANTSAVWLMKIETAGGVNGDQGLPGWEVPLNTSNEGVDPVVGEWQTYTFNISALQAAGEDISAIDFILVFPTWDQAAGAVYRIDNVVIKNGG